ncbi:hypothetical protein AVEN_136215-1 [Araneus ventricosus]|uniref:Uncharacterized protein n=1 Tax=Araneus ventricosus TaxID=182803 RepID=A0A4Y2WZN7_ARAVE|nr:hypothetical protein AVEN_136215-1 [Araneus ventricosus]
MQLGDKKPSQLLHEMQDLSFGKIEEYVLRMLWFQRLPITTQQILSASTDKLASLALAADKIAEVSGVGTCVNSVEVESARLNRLEAHLRPFALAKQITTGVKNSYFLGASDKRCSTDSFDQTLTFLRHFLKSNTLRSRKLPCPERLLRKLSLL